MIYITLQEICLDKLRFQMKVHKKCISPVPFPSLLCTITLFNEMNKKTEKVTRHGVAMKDNDIISY